MYESFTKIEKEIAKTYQNDHKTDQMLSKSVSISNPSLFCDLQWSMKPKNNESTQNYFYLIAFKGWAVFFSPWCHAEQAFEWVFRHAVGNFSPCYILETVRWKIASAVQW